jgi:hypothetical protein
VIVILVLKYCNYRENFDKEEEGRGREGGGEALKPVSRADCNTGVEVLQQFVSKCTGKENEI